MTTQQIRQAIEQVEAQARTGYFVKERIDETLAQLQALLEQTLKDEQGGIALEYCMMGLVVGAFAAVGLHQVAHNVQEVFTKARLGL
jgi:hypothetical protein